MSKVTNDTITVGSTVGLYCPTLNEHVDYKIVKNRDTVAYKPQFGSEMIFGSKLYYETVTKFAEYADDELVEDCPLAKALIGKKLGEKFNINQYSYEIEKIIFTDGTTLEIEKNSDCC